MQALLSIRELTVRLAGHVKGRVRRGELSERALARLTGYSQPHVHNVLQGARAMTPEFADRVMEVLGVSVPFLLSQDELSGLAPPAASDFVAVPLLDGRLGAGRRFPQLSGAGNRYFLPHRLVAGLVSPVTVLLDSEESTMSPLLEPDDWALVDLAAGPRRRPQFEEVYALSWKGRSFVGRCRVVGNGLVVAGDNPDCRVEVPSPMSLEGRDILDVVKGRIVWIIGRQVGRG